jgi:hypothetical protein
MKLLDFTRAALNHHFWPTVPRGWGTPAVEGGQAEWCRPITSTLSPDARDKPYQSALRHIGQWRNSFLFRAPVDIRQVQRQVSALWVISRIVGLCMTGYGQDFSPEQTRHAPGLLMPFRHVCIRSV